MRQTFGEDTRNILAHVLVEAPFTRNERFYTPEPLPAVGVGLGLGGDAHQRPRGGPPRGAFCAVEEEGKDVVLALLDTLALHLRKQESTHA